MITLSEVADIQTGPFGSQLHKEDYVAEGTPIVTVEHLGGRFFTRQNLPFVDDDDAERLKKYRMKQGDIIYSRVGSVDRCSYAEEENEGWLFSGRCLRVRPKSEINSEFLYYYLSSKEVKRFVKGIAVGATMPSINTALMGEIPIPDLPAHQQAFIAAVMTPIDRKIAINAKLNGYLEEIGKAIWRKAIETSGTSACIGDIAAEIVTGKTPSTKVPEYYGDKYPFITIPDMHSNVWLCSTERRLSETGNRAQPKKLVPRGAVLVSCIATLGLVGIVQKPSHFNQQINAVVPASEGDEFFLYYAMRSITQALLGIGATGSATLNVNKSAFSQIEIPWLEGKAMVGFVQTVRPIFETIEANSIESLRLRKLSDSLLPKLMSGEIDVSKVMF